MKRLLREPLLHFLVLGAALFVVFQFVQPEQVSSSSKEIQLSADELMGIVQVFQAQWKRPPTAEELKQLVENRVQEEVLYREALALRLDKDDTIVRRRMAQKMQFLSEDTAAREPTVDELKSWFDQRRSDFAEPSRISFRHLYFSPDRRGSHSRDDAAIAMTKLAGQPQDAKLAASLGDRFMFQNYYRDRTTAQLAKEFGPEFAIAVAKLTAGAWQGPIESGLGWHLVFVDTVVPGRVPAFEEIEGDVKTAWLADQKDKAWRNAYKAMREKYTVFLPGLPEKTSNPGIPTATAGLAQLSAN